jgi:serine/threonine protein kinase
MGDGRIMNDSRKASELVSRSLRCELSETESEQLAEALKQDKKTRGFAELSSLIQGSVAAAAKSIVSGTDGDAPDLPSDAKQRMRDSVEAASLEKLRLSQSGILRSSRPIAAPGTVREPGLIRSVSSRFQLIRPLGEGGLGSVWLVRDEKMRRTVAMKQLTQQRLESPKAWQRFQREAEITGMLEHPNIIPIYQFGDDSKSAEPFYTMRFVGKKTLADAVIEHHDLAAAGEADQLGLHRLLSVFLDICQAIAYAHSRGVVHRDLKPENVALDCFGQVVVLDWGLAKLIEEGELAHKLSSDASLTDSAITRTIHGDIVGTPLYMSPEQALGELDRINERTDVYGLGAILFAILTGAAPHAKSLSDGTDIPEAVRSIAERESPRTRDQNPSVPTELDSICAKAMARKQHMRFTSVQHFAEALEKWMAGQSDKNVLYQAMRAEGRELSSQVNSIVADLERNVRFMSRLPPISQLIYAESDAEMSIWRERLAIIFEGLLDANPDYRTVTYKRVEPEHFRELVRVERHTRDSSRIRIIPKSRLGEGPLNGFVNAVMRQKPGDAAASMVAGNMCNPSDEDAVDGLVAGVPVFDDATEDAFGLVLIDCNIQRISQRLLSEQTDCKEVVVVGSLGVLIRKIEGQIDHDAVGRDSSLLEVFQDAIERLQTHSEYIDEGDANIYGTRVKLGTIGGNTLLFLLRRN